MDVRTLDFMINAYFYMHIGLKVTPKDHILSRLKKFITTLPRPNMRPTIDTGVYGKFVCDSLLTMMNSRPTDSRLVLCADDEDITTAGRKQLLPDGTLEYELPIADSVTYNFENENIFDAEQLLMVLVACLHENCAPSFDYWKKLHLASHAIEGFLDLPSRATPPQA